MKKILFVINSMEGGGAERALAKLLNLLEGSIDLSFYEIHLALLDDLERQQAIPDYVKVHQLDAKGGLYLSIVHLNSLFKQIKPMVIVGFLTRSNCASVVIGKLHRCPVLISERVNTSSHLGDSLSAKVNKLIVKTLYPLASRILVVSGGVGIDLVENFRVPQEKVLTIHNAVDQAHLIKLAEEPIDQEIKSPYLCALGRLVPNKNFSMLIRAFKKANLACELWILGQGELENSLKKEAQELGIADKVRFIGFKKNPYPYLKNCLFYVSASNAEGFPNSMVEAMGLGKAVVATNCESGPSEILQECDVLTIDKVMQGKYGVLTPINDEQSMQDGLELMYQIANREHYELKSNERVKEYTPDRFKEKYWGAIVDCMELGSCG